MGSGRDKRKKARGKVPGQGEVKTAKKTEKNDSKAERRAAKVIEVGMSGTLPSLSLMSHPNHHLCAELWSQDRRSCAALTA